MGDDVPAVLAEVVAAVRGDALDPGLDDAVRELVRAVLAQAVDVDELAALLGVARGGGPVARSYAARLAMTKGFPDPLLDHRHLRVWMRRDVYRWLDRARPGWR